MGAALCVAWTGSGPVIGPTLAASALEGLGVLAYAGLVYLVLRTAARWAERSSEGSLDESASAATSSPPRDPRATKGPGA